MICELAKQEHCNAIVIGCRRSGTSSLGPTVDYVLRKAPCPVVLASGKQRKECFDSVASLGQQLQVTKTSMNSEQRFRRISCPAICSPPVVSERVGFGEAIGEARENQPGLMLEKTDRGTKDFLQLPATQRRHSLVPNAFQHLILQAIGQKELSRKKAERTGEIRNTKC